MGKRQIGEMQPFEFVVTLIIADLACIPMADVSIPLIYGVVSILALFLLHQLLSIFEQFGPTAKKILSGKPSIVIDKNGVNLTELRKNNLGIDDLIESMRASGYFSLDDLDYAIFESNGKLSPLENGEKNKEKSSLPLLVVDSFKAVKENLKILNCTLDELSSYLNKNGGKLSKTEVLTIDGNGRVYLKEKEQKYRILSFPLKEGVKW
ncbi:MAG: DUF421 domain-containing protein [Clostridia bacterium]|nr:DUF421 domain-containing protein [Clostridia bacterium]